MNSRYERDNDLQDLHDSGEHDREISLGTTTILGIFFALALLCAVFFGFGYSLGRRSVPPTVAAADTAPEPDSASAKPSSGSPATQGRSTSSENSQATADQPAAPAADSSDDTFSATSADTRKPAAVKTVIATPAPHAEAVKVIARPAAAVPVLIAGPGTAVVQVAAVSHQEDADVLAAALKRRGYNVSVRQTPQDKLLHVQVGPFATKKEADAMRQRLQGDGYNAIVK